MLPTEPKEVLRLPLWIPIVIAVVGILHATVVAIEHWNILVLEGLFFVTAGLVQLAMAYIVRRYSTGFYLASAILVNGGLAFMWIITRNLPAPFSLTPEPVGTLGLVMTIAELAVVGGITWFAIRSKRPLLGIEGESMLAVVAVAAVLSIGGGVVPYAAAKGLEQAFPHIEVAPHSHGSDDDHHSSVDEMHGDGVHNEIIDDHHDDTDVMIDDHHDSDTDPHE